MSTDLEQALRAAFRDAAETVVPDPDPIHRLLRRRRRRWAGFTSLFAAIAVVVTAALLPTLQLGPADRDGGNGYPITSAWTRALLDSPTRGSLAGDTALLNDVLRRAQRHGGEDLNRTKVLFLGDAAGRRFVAYARYNDTSAALYYNDGTPGDSVPSLVDGGYGDLPIGPLLTLTGTQASAVVGLAPAGCRIATSDAGAVEGNGDVRRQWTDAPDGSWVARPSFRPAERWRVTCDGTVRSEGPAVAVREVDDQVDLVAAGGLRHGPVVQRWTGRVEGDDRTWTLSTTLLTGGGAAAVLSTGTNGKFTVAIAFPTAAPGDSSDNRSSWGMASTAISSDPNVIAIRLPDRAGVSAYLGERVLIVTSAPFAWSVTGKTLPGTFGVTLTNGVATAGASGGVLTVNDVAGQEVGATFLPYRQDAPMYLGEQIVSAW